MKVMIVDDNKGMREMIRAAACTEDDTVMECSNGAEAVDAYATFRPDYVLMDVEMGIMDGFIAAEKIFDKDKQARIIFVTDHNTSAFRMKAKKLQAKGFVWKENLHEIAALMRR